MTESLPSQEALPFWPSEAPPTETERFSLFGLISICKERLEEEDGIKVAANDPIGDLYGIIKTLKVFGEAIPGRRALSPASRRHLERMMIIQSEFISQPGEPLRSSIRGLPVALSEFAGFKPDLSDLTPAWQLALADVLELQRDLHGEAPADV